MNRVLLFVLSFIATYVTCKVGFAALAAVILGLSAASLSATLAGVVGLLVAYVLWQWTNDLWDQAFPCRAEDE